MEGQYVPPAGDPQKVRNQKPRRRKSNDQGSQGVHGQQPPIRKSNRGAPQQQPEVADWAYNQDDQYGKADPTQGYPEHYGHGTSEHVDAHGYAYDGAYADGGHEHGYGYEYSYGDGAQGYGDRAHPDISHGHGNGYDYGDGNAAHGYDYGQEHGYDGAQVDAGQDSGYVARTQQVKRKAKKARNPRPVADGGEHHGAGYENQGDGYGQPVHGGYADGYAYPEAYNAIIPEQELNQNPQKRESKHRKPTRTQSIGSAKQGDGGSTVASRAVTGEPEGAGSDRSNRSKPGRSDRNMSADSSGGHRHRTSNQSEQEGTTPRFKAVERDNREGSSGRSNLERRKQNEDGGAKPANPEASALNEHLRKTGGGKPKQVALQDVSMVVFDPHDQTSFDASLPEPPQARSSLNEWMKKQGDKAGPKIHQDESLIVFDDRDKSELETRMFGAPLAKKQPIKLPPVEEQWDKPQYHRPKQSHQYQAPEKPQHRSAWQRRSQANHSMPQAVELDDARKEYGAEEKKQALQQAGPNAKCMACVHGVGVPLARLATRIACRHCMTYCVIL